MQAGAWEGDFPSRVGFEAKTYLNQNWFECAPAQVPELVRKLRDEEDFDMIVDLTAVDRGADPRFEIVYILYSFSRNERVRVKTRTQDAVPSIVDIFAGANWLEREAFDMFGIHFEGHPDLKRILMPEDWTGHPMRKETSIVAMDNDWVQRNLGIESGQ